MEILPAMPAIQRLTVSVFTTILLTACGGGSSSDPIPTLTDEERLAKKIKLGELIFEDENLSSSGTQSCASCHDSEAGFANNEASHGVNNINPVSEGAVPGQFGNRNAPTASYASLIPDFEYNEKEKRYQGGLFLDGRAENLTEQAKGPFLNPKEMNNADEADVISKIRSASYANLFKEVYGGTSLDTVTSAYNSVADAIATYEGTEEFQPFSSKYDAFLAGEATLSAEEERGLAAFTGDGLCASECHTVEPENAPLFSDFTYRNIGTPANTNLSVATDLGLGGALNIRSEDGKFRVPTLRNVALTAPYMHNGVFDTLEDVVRFYNTGSIDKCSDNPGLVDCWNDPEVSTNIDSTLVGDLGLTSGPDPMKNQEADIVAFLRALNDGYNQ